jgi:hypothetical protein
MKREEIEEIIEDNKRAIERAERTRAWIRWVREDTARNKERIFEELRRAGYLRDPDQPTWWSRFWGAIRG